MTSGAQAARRVPFDRVAVRYSAPETGGALTPRFLFDRQVAFLVRVEAILEDGALSEGYIDRHLRTTVERHIAEQMLAALQVRSSEPANLPARVKIAREDWVRLVGAAAFEESMRAEGISEGELTAMLQDRVRAMEYLDKEITSFTQPSEDDLYASFRASPHPYRNKKYDDARQEFLRWYELTRYRALSLDYLQGVKSRTTIVYL